MSDAENGSADDQAEGTSDPGAESESGAAHVDDYVRRMRPNPEGPPQRVVVLSGLLGDSDRPGWRRLYLSRDLNRYAEFRDEDLVYREAIPAEQAPMRGFESSRVAVRRGARIDFIVSRQGHPLDEFDLDLRIGSRGAAGQGIPPTRLWGWCPDSLDFACVDTLDCQLDTVAGRTCVTCFDCPTQGDRTCVTCGQATCLATPCGTCETCGEATCQATCANTCPTCANTCPATCANTCDTCNRTQCGGCPTEPPGCQHPTGRPNTCPPHCQVP